MGGTTDAKGVAKLYTRVEFPGAPVGKYKVSVIKNFVIEGSTSQQPAPTDPRELDRYKRKIFQERKVEPILEPEYGDHTMTPLEAEIVEGKNSFSFEVKKLAVQPTR